MKEERKVHNFKSEILFSLTLEKEGFDPNLIGYQKKHIWASCRYCGQPHRIKGRNFKVAGSACHKDCRLKEQSECGSPFARNDVKEKAKKTMIERYGAVKVVDCPILLEKMNKNRELAQSKIEQTNLERYGVKNVFQNIDIKEKIKQSNLEKYGVENPQQSKEIREKSNITLKNTLLERNDEIKEKRTKTNFAKYGKENPMQNEIIKEKSYEGYQNFISENLDSIFKLKSTLDGEEFWEEIKQGKTLKFLCEKFNLNYGSLTVALLKDEYKDKYYKLYSFPYQQKQKEVKDYIEKLTSPLKVLMNCRDIISPLELDIFIPEKKFAIEFNGSYWHSEAILDHKEAKKKHIIKTRLCKEKGIRLFHIFENTWDNRKDQILGFLKSALNLNTNKIFGRKCLIEEDRGDNLCEQYHIQGKPNSFMKTFDLIYNGDWVGSMVFGKHHRQNLVGNPVVLSRLVFKENTTIIGGTSKLFNRAKKWAKDAGYDRILSWSDNSWTEGNIYKVLGFCLDEEFSEDYFYWDSKNNKYLSKQSQKKSATGCPKEITERDWCFNNGLFRIYDCGKIRWSIKL